MSLTLSGSGSVTGLVAGGLPDATVATADIIDANVTQAKLAAGVAGNGPAFSAYLNTAQSISIGWSKIQINTEEFDTNNNFDSTTNYRFTPQVAGYYQINGWVGSGLSGATQWIFISIYKNGVPNKYGTNAIGTANGATTNVNALIYFNGTTDYVELYAYPSATTALNTGLQNTFFQGSLVRAT